MFRRILTLALLAAPAFAADWVEYRSGPLHIFSDAGDSAARERLTQLEQIRYVLGALLGKTELTTVWPIDLVLFANQKEYGPHALPQPLTDGGSADTGGVAGGYGAAARSAARDHAAACSKTMRAACRRKSKTDSAICFRPST